MHTSLSDFEVFDESGYNLGSSPPGFVPIVIFVSPTPAEKRPPVTGRRLRDVLHQMASNPEVAVELQEARRWVGREIYENESQSIQAIRLGLGLSQAELARLANTTQARVSKIENGEELPRFDMMKRLAAALRVDMNTLAAAIEYATARKNHEALSS